MLELLQKRHAEAIEEARSAEEAHHSLTEELEAQREQIKAVEGKIAGSSAQLDETDPFSKSFTSLAVAREQDKILLAALKEQLAAAEKKHEKKERELIYLRQAVGATEHAVLAHRVRTGAEELRQLVWKKLRDEIAPAFRRQAEIADKARSIAPQRQWLEKQGASTWWDDGMRLPWVHSIHGRHSGVDPDGDEFMQLVISAYRERLMVELSERAEVEQQAKAAEERRGFLERAGSIAG